MASQKQSHFLTHSHDDVKDRLILECIEWLQHFLQKKRPAGQQYDGLFVISSKCPETVHFVMSRYEENLSRFKCRDENLLETNESEDSHPGMQCLKAALAFTGKRDIHHLVTAVLRFSLMARKDPLLLFENFDRIIAVVQHASSITKQLGALRTIISSLPKSNSRCLHALLPLLADISIHQSTRTLKRSSRNVGLKRQFAVPRLDAIFTPLLLRARMRRSSELRGNKESRKEHQGWHCHNAFDSSDLADATEVVRLLIAHHQIILCIQDIPSSFGTASMRNKNITSSRISSATNNCHSNGNDNPLALKGPTDRDKDIERLIIETSLQGSDRTESAHDCGGRDEENSKSAKVEDKLVHDNGKNPSLNDPKSPASPKRAIHVEEERLLVPQCEEMQRDVSRLTLAIPSMSVEQLKKQKVSLKKELKQFNLQWASDNFGTMPTRHDKECLRPLYEYYNTLKRAILSREQTGETSNTSKRL